MGNITKSLQTNITASTGGTPATTALIPYVDTGGTPLVTAIKHCTVANLLVGAGLDIALNRVPFGTGTGLTSAAGFTCDGTTLVVPTATPGVVQPTTGYKSVDGTSGVTFAGASITTLSVKDGLVVAHT